MNKIIIALMALLVVGLITTGAVSAYRGNTEVQGPNFDPEVHEALEGAIESGDYDAWIQIREQNNLPIMGRMFSVITEANFELFAQMHEAHESGDIETANAIRTELGLGLGKGPGNGPDMHQGQGRMNGENFIDANKDGSCDSMGSRIGSMNKGRR